MNTRKNRSASWRKLCHELREDDGIDPKDLKKHPRADRPSRQGALCKQIERSLQLALAGCADEAIRELVVLGAEPTAGANRVVVRVALASDVPGVDEPTLRARLDRLRGYLRSQIARDLTRKRVPDLGFDIAPITGGVE